MKKIIILLILTAFIAITNAQTITDTREIGSWVFDNSKGRLEQYDHFALKEKYKFPPATINGWTSMTVSAKKTIKRSPAVQSSMQAIMQLLKTAYPKPYKESITYEVDNIPAHNGGKPLAYKITLHEEQFQYKNGKIIPINADIASVSNHFYGTIYVNYIPESIDIRYTSNNSSINIQNKLSYLSNTQTTNTKERPNGQVYALGPQNNFVEAMGYIKRNLEDYKMPNPNPPNVKFNNDADKYFVTRRLTANVSKETKAVSYGISNFVVLSLNNQLPFAPVSRKEFLSLLEDNLNEEAGKQKEYFEKYVKNTEDYKRNQKSIDKNNDDNAKDRKRKYEVINLIKEQYKTELEQPAILGPAHYQLADVGFYYLFNVKNIPTAKEIKDVFITDKNAGYSLFRFDKNFYNGLKEEDIKTIAFEWEERLQEIPVTDNFPDANYTDKKTGKLLADIKFHRALDYKFNWAKLATLLTK